MPPEHIIWLCCGFLAGLITDRKLYHPPAVLVTCYSVEHEVVADVVSPWNFLWLLGVYLLPVLILLWFARDVIASYYVHFCAGGAELSLGASSAPLTSPPTSSSLSTTGATLSPEEQFAAVAREQARGARDSREHGRFPSASRRR